MRHVRLRPLWPMHRHTCPHASLTLGCGQAETCGAAEGANKMHSERRTSRCPVYTTPSFSRYFAYTSYSRHARDVPAVSSPLQPVYSLPCFFLVTSIRKIGSSNGCGPVYSGQFIPCGPVYSLSFCMGQLALPTGLDQFIQNAIFGASSCLLACWRGVSARDAAQSRGGCAACPFR